MRIELLDAHGRAKARGRITAKDVIDVGIWFLQLDGTSAPRRERLEGVGQLEWRALPAP